MGLRTAFWVLAGTAVLAGAVVCWGSETDSSPLTLQQAVSTALSRDALVADAQQSLEDARAALVRARANTPTLQLGFEHLCRQFGGTGSGIGRHGHGLLLAVLLLQHRGTPGGRAECESVLLCLDQHDEPPTAHWRRDGVHLRGVFR